MKKKLSNKEVIKYFIKQCFNLKQIFWITFISTIIISILWLVMPIFFKEIIDIISNSSIEKDIKINEITKIFYYFVINSFIMFIIWRFLDYYAHLTYTKLEYNISLDSFKYLHKHSYDFFINNFAWALNKKVSRLVWSIQSLFDILIWDFTRFTVTLIFVVFVLSAQNIYLWLWFFWRIIFFIIVSIYLNKYKIPYVKDASNENSKISWMYADTIVNNFNISIFWTIIKEYEYIKNGFNVWIKKDIKAIKIAQIIFAILSIISITWEILLLYFSIYLWSIWNISVWTFVLILTYQIIIAQQIFSISFMLWRVSTNIWNAIEMIEILNTPHQIVDKKNSKKIEISSWKIEFKNVWFSYNKDTKVFENLSFKIKNWEKVAIVWSSWSGKTSIIRLLFRFYDIDNWKILIDWQDISEVTQDSLRSNISIVPQDLLYFIEV